MSGYRRKIILALPQVKQIDATYVSGLSLLAARTELQVRQDDIGRPYMGKGWIECSLLCLLFMAYFTSVYGCITFVDFYFLIPFLPSFRCCYSSRAFFTARSFTSSKSNGSALTCTNSLVALLGVESRILNASLTAEVSTPIRRFAPDTGTA